MSPPASNREKGRSIATPASSRFDGVLVANRGEIARRVMRSASAMGLRTVAVFVDTDEGAMFVEDADESVRIGSYLDAEEIVAAALRTGAGAVHPGYGFLAENADFARAVGAAGLAWVGPPPAAIAAMGDKIEAKKLAAEVGVPVLPSAEAVDDFASVGFPLLVKAAAGGGGKGMRVVQNPSELDEAVDAARREASGGFGDDRVFAERYVQRSRHIEIQILGDRNGDLVHLGERECSIQRRHQKIIEESPSPFVTAEMRAAMGEAAVALGAALGYESAGTVEFLVDDASGEFYFLEVNTRLQVEHPVTEEVTGIDLVREQLRTARGEPLGYGQHDISFTGHAIEARVYAEDPAGDFLPATGTLDVFEPAPSPAVRWDTGVRSGSTITVDFDPMIAKVIAHAPTRTDAAGRLALALERLEIGGVVTNRDFLAATLRSDAFLAGETTTDFIDRVDPARRRVPDDEELEELAVAAAMWLQGANRSEVTTLASLPSGFRIGRLARERATFAFGDRAVTVHYHPRRDGGFELGPDGDDGVAAVHRWASDAVDLERGGRRRLYRVRRSADRLHLRSGDFGASLTIMPRFHVPEPEHPGGAIAAPMPGRVVDIRVAVGARVEAGQVVAVLEAMKMENHLRAAEDGVVVDLLVAVGDQVEKDVVLMVIEDPNEVDDHTEMST